MSHTIEAAKRQIAGLEASVNESRAQSFVELLSNRLPQETIARLRVKGEQATMWNGLFRYSIEETKGSYDPFRHQVEDPTVRFAVFGYFLGFPLYHWGMRFMNLKKDQPAVNGKAMTYAIADIPRHPGMRMSDAARALIEGLQ